MELKKTHSSRPVGGAEMGSGAERTPCKEAAGGSTEVVDCQGGQGCSWLARQRLADPAVPHSHADKLGGAKGERNGPRNPRAPAWGNKASNH